MLRIAACALLFLTSSTAAFAEVVAATPDGFRVKTVVTIKAAPDRVYKALVDEVGQWWESSHTFSGDAKNLSITATPGGCFCEKLPNGGGVIHAQIVYVAPGETLRMAGAIGPLQEHGVTASQTWTFARSGEGTTVTFTFNAGGYFPGGLDKLAPVVDAVLSGHVRRLKEYVER